MTDTAAPGSPAAVKAGCTCPVLDNADDPVLLAAKAAFSAAVEAEKAASPQELTGAILAREDAAYAVLRAEHAILRRAIMGRKGDD